MSTAQPSFDDIWRLFQETDRRFQETDRRFQETDRLIKGVGWAPAFWVPTRTRPGWLAILMTQHKPPSFSDDGGFLWALMWGDGDFPAGIRRPWVGTGVHTLRFRFVAV